MHMGCNLEEGDYVDALLDLVAPDVVVNLAGESRPDVVERDPESFEILNVRLPAILSTWCDQHSAHYVHVSTQGVFGGENPPYAPDSPMEPVNEYGKQKAQAEQLVRRGENWTILRPTFVLGVRPMPLVGRSNPAEQILSGQPKQVRDRFFSILFARDAAFLVWKAALKKPNQLLHLGNPSSLSRLDVAQCLGCEVEGVSHDDFEGLADRPLDTKYSMGSQFLSDLGAGFSQLGRDWRSRGTVEGRARELALFLGLTEHAAFSRLRRGFTELHTEVAADFNRCSPETDEDLLEWYRATESYLWELSAFHADPGFNYTGMCQGIAERLKSSGAKMVLCLGDGIGDLTLSLVQAGFDATYHDLADSRTADFAKFRFWLHHPSEISTCETTNWEPDVIAERQYDAVISFDFLEHVTDVPRWTATIRKALVPGGWFFAQNAFGIGSGDSGSIPCHLSRNDRFEKDWTPLLGGLHFSQEGTSNWWKRAS
jgi:dTDP-4-dehydrorhamnose reductase